MIEVQQLTKRFSAGKTSVIALNGVDLKVEEGEFLLIKGESGSGKSTLLFTIAGMLRPTFGTVAIRDRDIFSLSEKERTTFRAQEIGFVFQSYYLLPYLNVWENIKLADKLPGIQLKDKEIHKIIAKLGLQNRLYHKPAALSAGEKQRAALARAFVAKPSFILADEPTGNLDEKNAKEVLNHLKGFQKNGGTVLMATHGSMADGNATRTINLQNGVLKQDNNTSV